MDNLQGKTIKQFEFGTDDGTIIITAVIDRAENWVDWYGHVKGYGTIFYLFGGYKVDKRPYKVTADYCVLEYYEAIIETKGD